MRTRNELGLLFAERGYLLAAEVGVQAGRFSEVLLSSWGGTLYMIDRWRRVDDYLDISNVSDEEHERLMEESRLVSARHGGRGVLMRVDSLAAAAQFSDGTLDAVYIDADHSKQGVLADLAGWAPKVRAGGVIAGHDYVDGSLPPGEFGVKSAVLEFFGREPDIVTQEPWPTWLFEVPAR